MYHDITMAIPLHALEAFPLGTSTIYWGCFDGSSHCGEEARKLVQTLHVFGDTIVRLCIALDYATAPLAHRS